MILSKNTTSNISKKYIPMMPSSSSYASTFVFNNLPIRKMMQKIEFFMGWVVIFLTVSAVLRSKSVNVEQTQFFFTLQSIAILHFKLSLFSRSFAYAVDLANAYIRFNGIIPKWLILHHSGVWVQHLVKTFFLTPQSPMHIIIFSLAHQSTHNTWTKKYSLALYWGNVLVGVLACLYFNYLVHNKDIFASRCFHYSFQVTSVGILLLVIDSHFLSKKRKESVQCRIKK